MLVDIVIPAYNPGEYLHECLISCVSQSYENFNIIVVDDNSTEDVERVVSNFSEVSYIRNPKNLGPGASRNVGINNGSGDLISFIDSDDIMHQDKLALSVERLSKSSEAGMCCGNYRIMVNRQSIRPPFYKLPIDINYNLLMKQNFVASGSTTVRRSVIDEVGSFNEDYWIAEDYDLWLRISERYPVEYIHNVLYYYSIVPGEGSLTQRSDIQKDHIKNINEIRRSSKERVRDRGRNP
jgi:glycosyltransferase involved in cell wall biosynthesis|tara:strand:- start:14887 stop:15600 length:714 start_codon:yes stop_codon:yes gene_type:complete